MAIQESHGLVLYEKLRENQVIKTHWIKKEYHAYHFGTKILEEILGSKQFDFPKSVHLISDIIKLMTKPNSIVLDYFVGSGTTGHSVLKVNQEDGGSRRFIAVTNNENKICEEVTFPRLERVIKGYKGKSGNIVQGLGGNLNYFKTSFLKKSLNADEMKIRVTENCIDLLCFKEGIFNEEHSSSDSYKIFKNGDKVLGIYNSFDYGDLLKLKSDLDKYEESIKKVYVFTFDNSGLNPNDFLDWKNIELEPIPQKILEIIGELHA